MSKLNKNLYIPENQSGSHVSEPQIWRWLNNMSIEFEEWFTQTTEKEAMLKYFETAKLLKYYNDTGRTKWWRRPYFRRQFSLNLTKAVNYLFSNTPNPKILDLGCGFGTQSLLYAALGAEVISIDINPSALAILKKRQQWYQQACKRELNITTFASDAIEFDYSTIFPLDGIFSMFAFNIMQPSTELLRKIVPALRIGGRLVIFDGNRCAWFNRLLPGRRRNTLTPIELRQQLEESGFAVVEHRGGIAAIPQLTWRLMPNLILRPIDSILTKSWFFSAAHLILANKISVQVKNT